MTNQATTKKKGRPTKAEQERKAREQAAKAKLAAEVAEIKRKADEYTAAVDAAHKATKATKAEQRAANAAALAEYRTALEHYHAPHPDIVPTPNQAAVNGLYDAAETVAYIVIRSRQAKTPSKIWDELQAAFVADAVARTGLVNLAILDSDRAAARIKQHHHEQAAKRIHMTDEQRAAELLAAENAKRTADDAKDTAEDMRHDDKAATLSERSTIVHAVIVQWYENARHAAPITADRLARYGLESLDELDELDEETRAAIQNAANFAALCAAAQRAIRELSHPDACRQSWTKAKRATAEQVAAWLAKYGTVTKATGTDGETELSPDARVQTKNGYQTLEYRAATKTKAAGWYIVNHGHTIALEEHIDEYVEDEDGNANRKDIADDAATKTEDTSREELLNLAAVANLADRERHAVHAFASDAARAKGQQAAEERKAKDGRKWSYRTMNAARYNAQSKHAQAVLQAAYGISAKTAANVFSTAVGKLKAAKPDTEEHTAYNFTAEMRKPSHICRPVEVDRPDLVAAVAQYAAEHGHRPDYYGQDAVIDWLEDERAAEYRAKHTAANPMTPDEYRQDESRRRWIHANRTRMESHHTAAAFAALDAAKAAAAFLAAMTPDEVDTAAKAAAEHESRRPNLAAALGDAKRAAEHAAHLAKVAEYHRRRAELNATRTHIVAEYAAAKAAADKAATVAKETAKAAKAAANW